MSQYLYLIKCQNFFKIGIANDVENRIAQLSTGNPFPLEIMASYEFENAAPVEAAIHQRYAGVRKRGEWFELDDHDLVDFEQICQLLGGCNYAIFSTPIVEDSEIEEAEEIQESAETEYFDMDDPRYTVEKRIDPDNGNLRGFVWREKTFTRNAVKYIGRRNPRFQEALSKFGGK